MSLSREERIILSLLSQYGPLRISQITAYFRYMRTSAALKLIERMSFRRLVYKCGAEDWSRATTISIDPQDKLSEVDNVKAQKAFWVVVDFIRTEKISGDGHSAAEYPSQAMLIVRGMDIYEVLVISPGDEGVVSYQLKNRMDKQNGSENENSVRFIAVIDDPAQIPLIKVPGLYAFALINDYSGKVTYIAPKANKG